MAEITAIAPDGTKHIFPLGTPDDIVDKTMKEYIASTQTKPHAESTQSVGGKEPILSKNPIPDYLKPFTKLVPGADLVNRAADYLTHNSVNDVLSDASNAARTAASTVIGTAAGVATGNPVAGTAAMSTSDAALQYLQHKISPSTIDAPGAGLVTGVAANAIENRSGVKIPAFVKATAGVAENFAETELGGKVIGKVVQAVKEGIAPGTIVKRIEDEVPWTLSQTMKEGTASQRLTKWLEDVGATSTKQAAVDTQNEVLQKQGSKLATGLAGESVDIAKPNFTLAEKLQEQEVKQNFNKSVQASNVRGNALRNIANQNEVELVVKPEQTIPEASTTQSVRDPITGISKDVVKTTPAKTIPAETQRIKGPVSTANTVMEAQKIVTEGMKGLTKDDPIPPAVLSARRILNEAGVFDDAGKLIGAKPISFDQAWEFKKEAGDLAFGNPNSEIAYKNSVFKNVYKSLDKDIEKSLPTWSSGSQTAQKLWDETKQIVANRYETFTPQGEVGARVKDLLNGKDVRIDSLDEIIQNPQKLQRLLNSGDLRLLVKGNPEITSSIAPTNTRSLLKGYTFSNLYQDSLKTAEDGSVVPNPAKMYEAWQGIKNSTSMKMIYNQQERANIDQFLKNVALTNQKFSTSGQHFIQYRNLYAILGAGTGIGGYLMDGLSPAKALITAGVIPGLSLTINQLGKLAINPQTRFIMQALASDQLPAGQKLAARAILNVLKGQSVRVNHTDGTTSEVKVK